MLEVTKFLIDIKFFLFSESVDVRRNKRIQHLSPKQLFVVAGLSQGDVKIKLCLRLKIEKSLHNNFLEFWKKNNYIIDMDAPYVLFAL